MTFSSLLELFGAQPEALVVVVAILLFLAWLALNFFLCKVLGYEHSPYHYVLYNKDLQKRSNHTTAFGLTVSLFFLIALVLASVIMALFGTFGDGFSYGRFAAYVFVAEIVIIIGNNCYAKKKLGKPLFSLQGWKDLGADIKKRAHENLEKQNKLDL